MARIQYERPSGIAELERDDYHFEKETYMVAYDQTPEGTEAKVVIPTNRVVRIDE